MSGASVEEDKPYQLLGFPPAREKMRLFFPRSCINRKLEQYNFVTSLTVSGEAITVVVAERRPPTAAQIWYHFGPDLQLRRFELHDVFRDMHAELRAAHVLDHDLTPAEEAKFAAVEAIRTGK